MKRHILIILLLVFAGVQTVRAQRVTLYSSGSKAYECDVSKMDSIVFSEVPQNQEEEEIVVTVDAYGYADGGHSFEKIDETSFYIDDIKYTAQNGDLVVTGYNNAFFKGAATIISKLKYRGREMDVVKIEKEAFERCTSLTSVTIPNSVTSIGKYAFSDCSGLTSVYITDLAAWCNISFYTYESNPLYYAHNLYLNGQKITDLVIPNSVTSIGGYAFSGCSLTSVTIPNSVTSIGESAFYACSGLTSVYITDLTAWCNITFYTYKSNPLYYAHNLYLNGQKITDLVIPNSVTSIGGYAFYGCSSLTSITIGNSVTSIGNDAFSGCSGLTSVTIPNSVTSIGEYAFYSCTSLTSITIPNSVTSIDVYAFMDCSGLTSITIPNSVTSIGYQAFYGCTSLTSITIPNSVTSIGYQAFYGCTSLTSVTLNSNAIVSATRSSDSLMKDIFGNQVKEYVIGNGVTSIGEGAFWGCRGLTSVTIGNSVTSIGNDAFSGCSGLTSVTIPNSVTSIGEDAFVGCSGLTSVTIPESVTSIGRGAFQNCTSLTDVYCYATTPPSAYDNSTWDYDTFDKSYIQEHTTLHVPAGSIDAYKAQAPWSYFKRIVAI